MFLEFFIGIFVSRGSVRDTANPNQKNIYGAALALIAIMYGIIQGIIAVASLVETGYSWKWQWSEWYMSGIQNKCSSYHYSLIG